MMFFAMCLLCLHNFGVSETIDNNRMQRRFMWKHMDNSMGGFMGSSARAMKNMFGELLPTMQTSALSHMHNNILDYLPSETTRVKYIIRNPHNRKPMKIIKIRSPKKVIKIMTVPKAIIEGKSRKTKTQFPSIDELRKLEKEQEMIAEGHIPPKSENPLKETEDAADDADDANDDFEDAKDHNEIITSQIHEFGDEWAPVHEASQKLIQFSTAKPYVVSKLHTKIIGSSSLSQSEKQQYEPIETYDHEDLKDQHLYEIPQHTYEVTEYTAEESVALPLTQDYRARQYIPHRSTQHEVVKQTTTTSTTTEEPNYPVSFLRKFRERALTTPSLTSTRFKASESAVATSWIPTSNTTFYSSREKQLQQPKLTGAREKWPPEVPQPHPFVAITSTENPVRFAEQTTEQVKTVRKGTRLKTKLTTNEDARPRELKQRGSVKFGDKLLLDQY